MRIGIVTAWFERGAAYVSRQYRDSLARQHQVFIYARGGESRALGDPAWDAGPVHWSEPSVIPLESAIDLPDFRRWIARHSLDAVLFNEQRWWPPVLECSRLGVLAGAYVDYYTRPTVPLFGCYDFLVCNTRRHHGVFAWHPQAWYVPWGTDLNLFRPVSSDPVEPGAVTFFHSAGMNPVRKGADLVLRAFDTLPPAARLVLHTQSGLAGVEELRPLAEKLQRQGRLRIHHQTVPAPGLYHLGDVYVYPSRLDGIGLTVPEALACGLPVIVPDEPPMNEFPGAGCGTLVPVAARRERSDAYYWPMCEVAVDRLAAAMQASVERAAGLSQAKLAARARAEACLNWMENSRELLARLAAATPLPQAAKAGAIAQALEFERRRSRESVRFWLSCHAPQAVRIARRAYRALRREPR